MNSSYKISVKLTHLLWTLRKNLLSPKFFRQINSFVMYLVNALLSRNFCKKTLINFRNFQHCKAVNRDRELSQFLHSESISRKYFFSESKLLCTLIMAKFDLTKFVTMKTSHHTLWKLQKFTLTLFWQKFRETIFYQLMKLLYYKELIWRNILSVRAIL